MVRLLLVEDNEMNRDMLSRRLIRKGAGCDDYDTKPIELPRLLAKMNQQLQRCGITVEMP